MLGGRRHPLVERVAPATGRGRGWLAGGGATVGIRRRPPPAPRASDIPPPLIEQQAASGRTADGRRGAVLDLVALSLVAGRCWCRCCWSSSLIITGHHAKGRGHKSEVHSVNFTDDERFKIDQKKLQE